MSSVDIGCAFRRVVESGLFLAEALLPGNPTLLPLLCWLEIAVLLASLRRNGR